MIVELVSIAAIGRLAIFLVSQLPIAEKVKNELLHKLLICDLCSGLWYYFVLCGLFRFELVSGFVGIYIPVVNEFLSGAIISFVVHLVALGWKLKFSEFTIVE